jgi:hypothetical protein
MVVGWFRLESILKYLFFSQHGFRKNRQAYLMQGMNQETTLQSEVGYSRGVGCQLTEKVWSLAVAKMGKISSDDSFNSQMNR